MKDEVFSLKLTLQYVRLPYISVWSADLDRAKTIALNWTTASIAKTSCEICTLLVYYTPRSGNSLPTFRDNLLAPFSKMKKVKRENIAGLSSCHSSEEIFLYISWTMNSNNVLFTLVLLFQWYKFFQTSCDTSTIVNVIFFLVGDSSVSEFSVPTFRNTVCSICI